VIRYLLLALYLLAVLEATFDLGLGLIPGLSAKNLLLYALIFTIFARAVLANTKIFVPLASIHIAFMLLAAYGTLSWVINWLFDPTYPSFQGLKSLKSELVDNFLFFLVFFFGPNNYKDAKDIFIFGLYLIALMSIMTIIDTVGIFDFGFMQRDADGRVRGPIGESNQYGAFMVFFVPLFAAMALGSKGIARIGWWLVFFCGFGLLIVTGSRGAYLGLLAGCIFGLKFVRPYFGGFQIWRTAGKMAGILLVIVLAIGLANMELVTERIEQSTSTDVEKMSSGRASIWRATVLVQAQEPFSFLVGKGWNAHSNSGIWKSAHNYYLLILFELGAIGVFLFGLLMYVVIRQVRTLIVRTEGKERVLMCGVAYGLFGLLVSIMFVDLSVPWFYIWSFLGMSLRIAFEKDQEFHREREYEVGKTSGQLA